MLLPANFNEQKKPQLFEGLSEESLQALLRHSIIHDYEGGRMLVQQGDHPEYIFLVLDGSLKTSRINEEGGEAVIRMLEAGETCMEAVLFMGIPSPINVQTMAASTILKIPSFVVKKHIAEDSCFAVNLLRIVARHYKNAMYQIEAMNTKSPLQRVGYYFLLKHIEQGHKKPDFKLPFQKRIVANHLGMTPETFSRTLKQMQKMGITVEDDIIKMDNVYALCDFCDSDTASLCSSHNPVNCKTCLLH